MTRFYVCMGKDCRKRPMARNYLERLKSAGGVKIVGCQKICKAPVIGIDRGKGPRWFKRVDTEKSRRGVLDFAGGGDRSKALADREIKKRAGKLRR